MADYEIVADEHICVAPGHSGGDSVSRFRVPPGQIHDGYEKGSTYIQI